MKTFEKEIEVRWSDVDQNRHVRHSAYYDYGAHIRIRYFNELGFNAQKFAELNIGPVIFKEECSFIRELNPDDTITINLLNGETSEDGSRWALYHEIFNTKGEKSAHLKVEGAWIDLSKRKLTVPPIELANSMLDLPKGEDFSYRKLK